MRKVITIFTFLLLFHICTFSQWSIQYSGLSIPHYAGLNRLYFTNSNTGFITSSNGKLYKTTNGGSIWNYQIISNEFLSSVQFVNNDVGFISATNGKWFKTTDGGNSWTTYSNAGYAGSLTDIFFVNLNTGWCVGGNGSGTNFVSKTTNGGSSWTVQRTFSEQNTAYSVLFLNASTGFNNCGNKIWLTTNGGVNWEISYSSNNYLCHFYFTGNTGYAVGLNGTIIKTTNSGFNWTPAFSPTTTKTLWQCYFQDANTGWIVADAGTIYYTTNGGLNYTQQTSGTTKDLSAVSFIGQVGWVLGSDIQNPNDGLVLTNQTVYHVNQAVNLHGSGDYITLPQNPVLWTFTNQITIEAWVCSLGRNVEGNRGHIISTSNQNDYDMSISDTNASGKLQLLNHLYPLGQFNSRYSINPNTWTHVCITYDGSFRKIFINGNLDTFTAATGNIGGSPQAKYPVIGAYLYNGTYIQFLNGILSEVRVWKIARTQAQIQQNMCRLSQTDTAGLIGYWKLNGNYADSSHYNNNGTPIGSPTFVNSYYGCDLPLAPSDFSAIADSTNRMTLSWTDNSTNEDGFKIERSTDGGINWDLLVNLPENTVLYLDTGLVPYSIYHYRVFAYNSAGNSPYSNVAYDTARTFDPKEDIFILILKINTLKNNNVLNQGQANSLISKLTAAREKIIQGKINVAINLINAFINQVYSYIENAVLTAAQGQPLIDMANGIINQLSPLNGPLSTGDPDIIPSIFALYNNHPNPFNPITTIYFDLPNKQLTKITIYDEIGRLVSVIVNEEMTAGRYKINWDASNYASGIYFYRIEAGSFVDTKKMVLLK